MVYGRHRIPVGRKLGYRETQQTYGFGDKLIVQGVFWCVGAIRIPWV